MAVSTAKQPLPPRLSPPAAVKSTPECCWRLTFPSVAKEQRRFLFLKASLREESSGGGDAVRARSKGVQAVLDGFPYGYAPKEDAPSLPKPLSSAESSNSSTGGSRLLVAYQGFSGAYSESAAEKAYPNCEAVPCEQFDTAFQAVERRIVDRAVLPIENSLGGSIHRNYDLLLRHRLHIVGEVKLAISHCLLANYNVEIEDLKRVLSRPQHVAYSGLKDTGASESAAKVHNLKILATDIQDDRDNVTRFLMLAREPNIPDRDRPYKTSIVFSLEEGLGSLFKALAVFSLRQINLTKIESRPLRRRHTQGFDDNSNGSPKYFDYLFYVDFEASMADENAQNALSHLVEFATFLKVLGSYLVDTSMI